MIIKHLELKSNWNKIKAECYIAVNKHILMQRTWLNNIQTFGSLMWKLAGHLRTVYNINHNLVSMRLNGYFMVTYICIGGNYWESSLQHNYLPFTNALGFFIHDKSPFVHNFLLLLFQSQICIIAKAFDLKHVSYFIYSAILTE